MPRLRSSVTECCVGFVFCSPDGPMYGHERHVHVEDVLAADLVAELPDRLEEREDLDVADGAADLGDHDVDVVGGERVDARLDLVGDVRDHLHGLAQVLAPPFLGEHGLVDRSGRRVRLPGQRDVDEALVVAEVEVGLALVVGDEDLTVLERVHRPGVDVDVRVELLHRDPQPAALEESSQRGGGEPFAQARRHTTRHEDVLRHRGPFWSQRFRRSLESSTTRIKYYANNMRPELPGQLTVSPAPRGTGDPRAGNSPANSGAAAGPRRRACHRARTAGQSTNRIHSTPIQAQ